MNQRSELLASRLEKGAEELAQLVRGLSEQQWQTPLSATDRRTVGVIVHHVASMYPLEIAVAQAVANGNAVTDVTWEAVANINATHAEAYSATDKRAALDLLRKNSQAAAAAIRTLTDRQLDTAAPFSLSDGAPMTVQFVIEDHALRHSWHHAAGIRKALKLTEAKPAAA